MHGNVVHIHRMALRSAIAPIVRIRSGSDQPLFAYYFSLFDSWLAWSSVQLVSTTSDFPVDVNIESIIFSSQSPSISIPRIISSLSLIWVFLSNAWHGC